MRPDPHSPSDERVRDATGRDWQAWFAYLDERDAATMDHAEVVALVAEAGDVSPWWQQTVTVAYEKARGRRAVVGETADAGFQVGVRRTVGLSADAAWTRLVHGTWRDAWLGPDASFEPSRGASYRCDDGTTGEVRSLRPGRRLRLTWQPSDWPAASTLQLTVDPKGDRCVIALHHERLPDAVARRSMKARWTTILDGFQAEVADAADGPVG